MIRRSLLLTTFVVAFLCAPVLGAPPKVGDKVWAQWRPNAWYPGKASKVCAIGLHVVFDDGDEADLPVALIVVDTAPQKNTVKVGSRVLGFWTDRRFYPGTVTKIANGQFDIQFDDGDRRTVGLDDLRLWDN